MRSSILEMKMGVQWDKKIQTLTGGISEGLHPLFSVMALKL